MRRDIRRANHCRKAMLRFGDHVSRYVLMPLCILSAGGGRPHQVENRQEVNVDIHRPATFDLISENCRGTIKRYEELLTNDVVGTDVSARDGFRAIVNAPQKQPPVCLRKSAFRAKANLVVTEYLEGIAPDLEPSLGIAHDDRTLPVNGNEAPRSHGVRAERHPIRVGTLTRIG